MPIYNHVCRECGEDWLEEYSLETYDYLKKHGVDIDCPTCESDNTYRAVGHIPVHFKGGGWSPQGYYKFEAYDQLQAEGKKVTRYEDKAEMDRVIEGEKKEKILKRMKREDELAKKYLGPDAAFTEKRAEKALQKRMKRSEGQ